MVAEKQLQALEQQLASHDSRVEAKAETIANETIDALRGRLRDAEERVRTAELRLPMLETAAKQAEARAASEAAARQLLQARAEASEGRLGRLEAAQLLLQREAAVRADSDGEKPARAARLAQAFAQGAGGDLRVGG